MIGARIRYFLTEAWAEFKHSAGANHLAATTLAAVLLLAASLLLVLRNAERQIDRVRGDARVDVYLRDDATPEQVEGIRDVLSARPWVSRIASLGKMSRPPIPRALRHLAALAGSSRPIRPRFFEVYILPCGNRPSARGVADAVASRPGVRRPYAARAGSFGGGWRRPVGRRDHCRGRLGQWPSSGGGAAAWRSWPARTNRISPGGGTPPWARDLPRRWPGQGLIALGGPARVSRRRGLLASAGASVCDGPVLAGGPADGRSAWRSLLAGNLVGVLGDF